MKCSSQFNQHVKKSSHHWATSFISYKYIYIYIFLVSVKYFEWPVRNESNLGYLQTICGVSVKKRLLSKPQWNHLIIQLWCHGNIIIYEKKRKNKSEYKKLKMVIMYVHFQLHLPKDCKIQLPVDPVVLSLFFLNDWIFVFGRSYVHFNKVF